MSESILRRCPQPEGSSYFRLVIVDATDSCTLTALTSPYPAQESDLPEVDPEACEQRCQSNQCPRGVTTIFSS